MFVFLFCFWTLLVMFRQMVKFKKSDRFGGMVGIPNCHLLSILHNFIFGTAQKASE